MLSKLIDLFFALQRLLKDILFEDASALDAVREDHYADTVLDASVPHAHVDTLVSPAHHSVPVSLIVQVVALVAVSRFPLEDTRAVLFVAHIHAFVLVALRVSKLICLLFLPLAVAVFEAILELSCVAAAIFPLVLAESLWFALTVLADIAVTVGEEIRAIAFSQTCEPLALILVSVGEDMHTVALGFRVHPLANVGLSVLAFPDSVPVFDALLPLAIIHFAMFPLIDTFAIRFAIFVSPMVRVSIREKFVTPSMPSVLQPFTLVCPTIRVDKHTKAFSLSGCRIKLASIYTVFVLLDAEILQLSDSLIVKFVTDHLIYLNTVTLILKLAVLLTRRSKPLINQLLANTLRHFRVNDCLSDITNKIQGFHGQLGYIRGLLLVELFLRCQLFISGLPAFLRLS